MHIFLDRGTIFVFTIVKATELSLALVWWSLEYLTIDFSRDYCIVRRDVVTTTNVTIHCVQGVY